jgi:hypothetical protein
MGLFDKINLLHVFMFLLFVIGLLLLITAFSAYSKLTVGCVSDSLKTKLRLAIGLGTTFVTIAIGYTVCVSKKSSMCQFGQRANWKIYTMLTTLMAMGGGLLVLATGIKSDLASPSCNVDLGVTPDILTGLGIAQIALPALYIVYILYSGLPKGSKKVEKEEEEEEEEPESDESLTLEAESRRTATNVRRLARYKKTISQKSSELDEVRDRIEIARERKKNPTQTDLAKQDRLIREISESQKFQKEVGSVGGDNSSTSSSSSVSSSSVGSGGFGGFGGFGSSSNDSV